MKKDTYKTFIFKAKTEQDFNEWIYEIQDSIAKSAKTGWGYSIPKFEHFWKVFF